MSVTNILLLEQHLMPDYAHQPNLRPTKHTHLQKGHCLPNDLCQELLRLPIPPTAQKTLFFQFSSRRMHKFSYHTTAQK